MANDSQQTDIGELLRQKALQNKLFGPNPFADQQLPIPPQSQTPDTDALRQLVAQGPPKVGKLRSILGGIVGGIAGFGGGGDLGIAAHRAITQGPYQKQLAQARTLADLEQASRSSQAKIGTEESQAAAERAHQSLYEAQTKGELQRPVAIGRGGLFNPQTGQTIPPFSSSPPPEKPLVVRPGEFVIQPGKEPQQIGESPEKAASDEFSVWRETFTTEHGRSPTSSEINNFRRNATTQSDVMERADQRRLDSRVNGLVRNHQKVFNDAGAQLDRITESEGMLRTGTAESQALAVPKVMTAIISGQGTGIRITQPELNAIIHAHGIVGDIQGWLQSISGQGKLLPKDRQQLLDVLTDVKKLVQKKQKVADDTIDKLYSATSMDEATKADSEARKSYEGTPKMTDEEFLHQLLQQK